MKKITGMEDVKLMANMSGHPMYEIAEVIGIHPSTLSVWFRKYDPEHKQKIMDAIKKLEGGEES